MALNPLLSLPLPSKSHLLMPEGPFAVQTINYTPVPLCRVNEMQLVLSNF